MLDLTTFQKSLADDLPPQVCPPLLQALWWDANNNWKQAHRIAQDIATRDGSRVHAYLHRKEGDNFNAGYWYSQAGLPEFEGSLEAEWTDLVRHFLGQI
ncbi:MAG: hypothetical protein K8I00_07615 [Candidatus Omnitrophica bacterium]|nr:hypothetical protein [Candidatus Omnitrophota bacterium]